MDNIWAKEEKSKLQTDCLKSMKKKNHIENFMGWGKADSEADS